MTSRLEAFKSCSSASQPIRPCRRGDAGSTGDLNAAEGRRAGERQLGTTGATSTAHALE